MKKKTFLDQVMGTSTKERILRSLIIEGDGVTRHELSKRVGGGIGPIYQQVDQLIASGILTQRNKKVHLDTSSPFIGSISDLVITSDGYFDDLRTVQDRIDSLFGNDYYITGYLGACQMGFPMDHEPSTIDIAVLNPNKRKQNLIEGLDECSSLSLSLLHAGDIPSDVRRVQILGTEVWAASVERSLVDMIKGDMSQLYPFSLLLVQNYLQDNLNLEMMITISRHEGVLEKISAALSELPNLSIELLKIVRSEMNEKTSGEIRRSVKMALNTVMGG